MKVLKKMNYMKFKVIIQQIYNNNKSKINKKSNNLVVQTKHSKINLNSNLLI